MLQALAHNYDVCGGVNTCHVCRCYVMSPVLSGGVDTCHVLRHVTKCQPTAPSLKLCNVAARGKWGQRSNVQDNSPLRWHLWQHVLLAQLNEMKNEKCLKWRRWQLHIRSLRGKMFNIKTKITALLLKTAPKRSLGLTFLGLCIFCNRYICDMRLYAISADEWLELCTATKLISPEPMLL